MLFNDKSCMLSISEGFLYRETENDIIRINCDDNKKCKILEYFKSHLMKKIDKFETSGDQQIIVTFYQKFEVGFAFLYSN